MRYKIRFNLKQGDNYLKWVIVDTKRNINIYYNNETIFELEKCILKNDIFMSKKIFNGAHKSICAWIEFDNFTILDEIDYKYDKSDYISYNPRKIPHWVDSKNINIDKTNVDNILIYNKKIFIL